MFTKKFIEEELKQFIEKYNAEKDVLGKKAIKLSIRLDRQLIKEFERRNVTEMKPFDFYQLMETKRYFQYLWDKLN